jgi:hypothetical protein
MNAFVVTVDFGPEPGTAAAFRKFIDENAQNVMGAQNRVRVTRRARVHGANDCIFLYELCSSRTAFPPHLPFAALRRIQQDQWRSRDERDRCKAHLIFRGIKHQTLNGG